MMLLEGITTDAALSPFKALIDQLAHIEFTGAIFFVVFIIVSGFICFEGYRLYRAVLGLIGFIMGYTLSHSFIAGMNLTSEQMLMGQTIAGLVLAVLAWHFVRAGIFIAAYHVAQQYLAPSIVLIIAKELDVNSVVYMLFSGVAAAGVAAIIAWLSVKAERPVIVIITAVFGGFALVSAFRNLLDVFPYDVEVIKNAPEIIWTGAKIFVSAAGIGIQGIKKGG